MIDRFAFYGSLRRGCYNHHRLLDGEAVRYVDTVRVPGFKMISLGHYPAAYRDENGAITVELFEVDDKLLSAAIDGMEIGARYKRANIWWGGHHYRIYIITPPSKFGKSYQEVESGDWVSHEKITRQEIDGVTLRNNEYSDAG